MASADSLTTEILYCHIYILHCIWKVSFFIHWDTHQLEAFVQILHLAVGRFAQWVFAPITFPVCITWCCCTAFVSKPLLFENITVLTQTENRL